MSMPKQCGNTVFMSNPPEDYQIKSLYCVRLEDHEDRHRNNTGDFEWDDQGKIFLRKIEISWIEVT